MSRLLAFLALFTVSWCADSAERVTYYYTDQQGTPLVAVDGQSGASSPIDYRPYGLQALGARQDGPGYTGHVSDVDSSLVYMQARYYDPTSGRFLGLDPVSPDAGNVFNINRYAYVSNNPISHTDPTGEQCAQCLYWPGNEERQAQINAAASGQALVMSAAVLAAAPAAAFVGTTAAAVTVDTVASGSLYGALMANGPSVVASTAIVADGAAGASGAVTTFSDDALVVRGGNLENQSAENIQKAILPSRTEGVVGFSCQCNGGSDLSVLGNGVKNKQIAVTTAGVIRAAGGEVVATPGNKNHVTITGLTGAQASPLLQNVVKNPNPQK